MNTKLKKRIAVFVGLKIVEILGIGAAYAICYFLGRFVVYNICGVKFNSFGIFYEYSMLPLVGVCVFGSVVLLFVIMHIVLQRWINANWKKAGKIIDGRDS